MGLTALSAVCSTICLRLYGIAAVLTVYGSFCVVASLPYMSISGRLDNCEIEGVSVTNYGIAIAKMHGILERALSVFHICQV